MGVACEISKLTVDRSKLVSLTVGGAVGVGGSAGVATGEFGKGREQACVIDGGVMFG